MNIAERKKPAPPKRQDENISENQEEAHKEILLTEHKKKLELLKRKMKNDLKEKSLKKEEPLEQDPNESTIIKELNTNDFELSSKMQTHDEVREDMRQLARFGFNKDTIEEEVPIEIDFEQD